MCETGSGDSRTLPFVLGWFLPARCGAFAAAWPPVLAGLDVPPEPGPRERDRDEPQARGISPAAGATERVPREQLTAAREQRP
jgi:hypothetical protein